MWFQKSFQLAKKQRGFHLVTDEVLAFLPELASVEIGILHLFIQHTSASLTLNENADPTVRQDLERHFNEYIPENASYYQHNDEGSDDIPAHIKATTIGSSVNIPITQGRLNLGVWQGVYLCEHRNYASGRTLVATIQGE